MKKVSGICLLLFGVAILATVSASSVWAACIGGIDPGCECGDIVVSDTNLSASDPVLTSLCPPPAALFVAGGVTLNVSSARIRCDSSQGFTVGLWLIGSGVTVGGGSGLIDGCDIGIYVPTSSNTIESLTVKNGGSAGVLVDFSNGNTLRRIWCDNFGFNGIFVFGDDNLLERNYCKGNAGTGIVVLGLFNDLRHNQGRNNGGQGVFADSFGTDTTITDQRNYGTANVVKPDCQIDNNPPIAGGRYC